MKDKSSNMHSPTNAFSVGIVHVQHLNLPMSRLFCGDLRSLGTNSNALPTTQHSPTMSCDRARAALAVLRLLPGSKVEAMSDSKERMEASSRDVSFDRVNCEPKILSH